MPGTWHTGVPSWRTRPLAAGFFSSFSKSNYLKHYKFSRGRKIIFLSATLKFSSPITAPFDSLLKLISALKELAC